MLKLMFSKNLKKNFDNLKETPSKDGHNRPPTFFLSTGTAAQNGPKTIKKFQCEENNINYNNKNYISKGS